jgi:peptidoglycan hydrolase-like protein with peptidoglycan-binding domain
MALTRLWAPSPNYSAGRSRTQLVVVHTSEGSTTEAGLSGFVGQPSSGVSYHVCYDDVTSAGQITEMVERSRMSWSALAANDWGVHGCLCTPSGASGGWSRDVWLSHSTMLAKCAAWIAEEAAVYGVPLRFVSAAEVAAGVPGVCGHNECSQAGAGGSHFDPGPAFPWDVVLEMAGGAPGMPAGPGSAAPPAPGGAAPPFPGTLLVNFTAGHGTATWQRQMLARGWPITVDDLYGGQSEDVCRSFQAEKGLDVDGIVGPQTWAAAWTAPIT